MFIPNERYMHEKKFLSYVTTNGDEHIVNDVIDIQITETFIKYTSSRTYTNERTGQSHDRLRIGQINLSTVLEYAVFRDEKK